MAYILRIFEGSKFILLFLIIYLLKLYEIQTLHILSNFSYGKLT